MQKTDKSYRRSISRVMENYIPDSVRTKLNRSKSWKYGYNEQFDMVVISKDGTVGDVIEINELLIALPEQQKKIRFEEWGNKEQKWTRYQVPNDLRYFDKYYKDEANIESKLKEVFNKHKDFIDDDISRKFNGDWFMNDGDPCVVVSKTAFGEISAVLFNDACKSPQLVVGHDYQKVTPLAKVDVTVEVKG